ncbi:MAG: hypothetical protein ABIP95_13725 [Pelobium sp.]
MQNITINYRYKSLLIRLLNTFILILISHSAFSQLFDSSQNPPSVKFRQINTPKFQIVYPTLFESEAQRMANVLTTIIDDVSKSLGHAPKPITIILQTQGVVSNGFVQMAPRKSEFYTIPGQEFDSQDWLNSLAVHELRHVVQFDKLAPNLSAPLFEELKLALFGINLPPWYFEGDAVGIETALTNAGRGRQPNFDMVLRTNEVSGNRFSYSKNYFGSLKSYTPGYYPLGYFMTTKIRRDYGPEILDHILERIKNFPIRPYNFSSSLKKFGGTGTHQLYLNTMKEMDSLWIDQLSKVKNESYTSLNKEDSKIPTNYLLPYPTEDGSIICLKGSKAKVPAIVLIKNNEEEEIIKIGNQTEPNLNYAAKKVVWDEYRIDPRFGQRSYNVICSYDLKNKAYKQITHKTRLFAPALSPDGKKISAIKISTENIFNLVELDAVTGEEIKVYPNPENFTLQTPAYNSTGDRIVLTLVNEQGKTLMILNTESGKAEKLLPQVHQIISRPCFYADKIIYKAHYNGIDNIYAVDIVTKNINQLSESQFGAFNPSVNSATGMLLFNDYQSLGSNIASIDLNSPGSFKPFPQANTFVNYFSPLIAQENRPNVFKEIPNVQYSSTAYKEFSHLFYFHSLRPILQENPYLNDNDFGFDLASDNKLSTVSATVGYLYNNALHKSQYNASLVYSKYYPQLSLNYENRARLSYASKISGTDTTYVPFQWRENFTALKVNIPFSANWLNKTFYFNTQIETSYTNRYQLTINPVNFRTVINFPMKYTFTEGLNTSRSPRDLAPKWGQNIGISYSNSPFSKFNDGDKLVLQSQFYLPGFLMNHSLQVSYNWQSKSGIFIFDQDITRASGYANLAPIKNLKNSLLLNYQFPVFYPDWELGPLAYIKRFRGGFFADFENIGNRNGLRTYGATLKADMNLLRFYLPNFAVGGKLIIPTESITKNPIFEFSFTYSF